MPTLDIDGATVAYGEIGSGPTVVMLHCSASSGGQWREIAARLAPGWRVVTPDLFGFGDTAAWPGNRRYSLAEEGRIVSALAEQAGGSVHLVGHSYGGAVALRHACHHPRQVATLTLIEPVAFHLLKTRGHFDRSLYDEIGIVAGAVAASVVNGDYDSGMRCFVDYWNGEGAWSGLDADRRRALGAMAAKVAMQFEAATGETGVLDDCRRIHVPTLIVRGGRSPAPVQRIAQLIAGTAPRARLHTYRAGGHMLPITHPETVAALLVAHLSGATDTLPAAA